MNTRLVYVVCIFFFFFLHNCHELSLYLAYLVAACLKYRLYAGGPGPCGGVHHAGKKKVINKES